MGNNSSSEAPRKPHKLSKPRVSTHASAASLSNSNLYALPKNARFSNSYLVGWLPVSPAEPPSNDLTPINIGVAVPGEQIEGRTSVARGGSRRDAKRSGALSSKSSQYDESIKTQANIDPSFRPGSEAQQRFPRPLARAESMPTVCQLGGKRGSVHYDMSSYEVQRLLVTRETLHQPMTKSESYTEVREVTESTWKSSHPASTPVSRANSELTLYMPTRRRSMIQTPGVATRSEQTIERISTRSSFRKSLPPTPSECKENPFESIAKRRMSMPPVQADFGSFMAAQTPSEGEYKQLGGMKFGTLHITNGAPELTPGPDNDGENCRDPRLGVGTVRQGYFERTESSFMTAGVNLDKIEDEEVLEMPSRRPSTKNQSLAEDYSPSRNPPSLKKVDKILPSRSHNSEEEKPTPGSSIAEPVSPTSPLPATPKAAAIGGRTPPEYLSTETLDVKENSDAKANPEMFRLELEHKTMRNLARYDSGISSSPSSETSRKALSKADSGYSSNVSLRSIQSLKRGSTERSQKSSEKLISEVPKRRSSMNPKLKSASGVGSMKKHDRSKSELPPPPPPPPKDDIPPAPTRRSSFSSLALSTINRIPTLRSSKSRDSSLSRSSTKARLGEERVKPANQDLSALVSHGEAKHRGQLQRLLSGSRTKAPSKGRDNHLDDQRPPATQSRAEPRSRRHRRRVPAASHRLELRDRASRDTLRTILSVGSTDMLQTGEKVQTTKPAQSVPKPIPPRKRSLHSISHSITQATSNLFLSKKPSVNKIEVPADVQIDSTRPEIILSHEARASGIDSVQRSMGNSAFDQAFTAIPVDRGSFSQRKRALTKMQYMEIRSNDQTAPLKTQKSASNIDEVDSWPLSPSVPGLSHPRKSKTPPPVSMRTRSSKNLRRPSPDRSLSAPPSEVPLVPRSSFSRHGSQESMASHRSGRSLTLQNSSTLLQDPNSRTNPLHKTTSHRGGYTPLHSRSKSQPNTQIRASTFEQAPSYSGIFRPGTAIPYPDPYQRGSHQHKRTQSDAANMLPAWPLAHPSQTQSQTLETANHPSYQIQQTKSQSTSNPQGHVRHGSSGSTNSQNAPFRILHSYNSPAYRGVPIWS